MPHVAIDAIASDIIFEKKEDSKKDFETVKLKRSVLMEANARDRQSERHPVRERVRLIGSDTEKECMAHSVESTL